MQLKNYQEETIRELTEGTKGLLDRSGNQKYIFKSPTGSGKTIVMAEFLHQLVDDHEVGSRLSFIWTAPRKLHEQSKKQLEDYYSDSNALECSEFEDLNNRKIQENEILFFNWESINKEDNVYIRENERNKNLENILERTKNEGREIILIIDESHHHATSDLSKRLIRDIDPKVTLEVSATPVIDDPDDIRTVPLEDVKNEGMIKKSVVLNPDFDNVLSENKVESSLSDGADSLVLDEAVEKRKELEEAYRDEGVSINPLLLIQLPDQRTKMDKEVKEGIINRLDEKFDINTQNGKLAIHLSDDKQNLENIAKKTHESQVLIFKQALALGWDCPRAQILALFRDWNSITFSVQTIGRIMRMPEPEKGHYDQDLLNQAYVYTNISDIQIKQDIADNYVSVHNSYRIEGYDRLELRSVYRKRQRERTRLSSKFIEIFIDEAQDYGLANKVDSNSQSVQQSFISHYETETVDELIGKEIEGGIEVDTDNEEDLQRLYDFFVRDHLTPFYPEDRSIGRVKESIYAFFRMELGIHYTEKFEEIIKIVLSDANSRHFISVLDNTKEEYIDLVESREKELNTVDNWEVPKVLSFPGGYTGREVGKSVIEPFYYDGKWESEEKFISYLENTPAVEWWFKNGDRDRTFFAVPYRENGNDKPFYVDFLVKFKDGRIGLFDTKSGITIETAASKSEGLRNYIEEEKKKGRDIFGGLITNTDQTNYEGSWKIYRDVPENLSSNDLSNWDSLSSVF